MKVRVMSFDLGDQQSRLMFRVLYESFMSGASSIEKRTYAMARQEARVLDILDPVSIPRTDLAVMRELRERPGESLELQFEVEDFNLIQKYLEQGGYSPFASRVIRDFGDWLSQVPTRDKE